MGGIRVAIEGCGHGTLHAIYASVEESCKAKGWLGVDLLIICGDFQAVRNVYDLNCVAMPEKYREMHDFHEYYSGARKAPYLTVFVGGNHEASNYLFELYYGGWVAENIYYMGAANVLQLGPIKIAGMSGIWKGYDYKKSHFERLPYNDDDVRSIFHVRELDTRKLLQLQKGVDIGISHDWPRNVVWEGDYEDLFQRKSFLRPDAENGQLGNVAAQQVLSKLRPHWWFSAHLHCKFAATVEHDKKKVDKVVGRTENKDEIEIDPTDPNAFEIDETEVNPEPAGPEQNPDEIVMNQNDVLDPRRKVTHFLALDKCGSHRDFLQLLEYPVEEDVEQLRPLKLSYDKEWLAITRAFAIHESLILGDHKFDTVKARSDEEYADLIRGEGEFVDKLGDDQLVVPENFSLTAPVYQQESGGLKEYSNPQTIAFCKLLNIPNSFDMSEEERAERMIRGARPAADRPMFDRGRGRGGRGGHGGRGGRGGHGGRGGYRGRG